MPEFSAERRQPAVSIILPTYNRARFLPQALASIRAQQWTDWELIIVDDGSTDNTRELIPELTAGIAQPVQYIEQENQGPYGARNTGLDHAGGKYVAFYDSDDEWLPHHLKDCVEVLEANSDVDWIYGACRIVDSATEQVLSSNTFYQGDKPRPFLELTCRRAGAAQVIDDSEAISCAILHGFYNGLQNSVIRSTLFQGMRFESELRNEAEDRLVVIRSLARGHRFAYLDNVHVIYRIHGENSSAASQTQDLEKRVRVLDGVVKGYEALLQEPILKRRDQRTLRRRLGRECFWHLGYATLWQAGRRADALQMFRRGLRHWPWDISCWKTYFVSALRVSLP